MNEYYAAGFVFAVVALSGIDVTRLEPWQCGTAACFEGKAEHREQKIRSTADWSETLALY